MISEKITGKYNFKIIFLRIVDDQQKNNDKLYLRLMEVSIQKILYLALKFSPLKREKSPKTSKQRLKKKLL